ncbi:MAG: hypothetical protein D6B28_02650 [Gammaproteobacteria bacterium]|nr:MAG: hypothetical protein D6B28_02650 [Gammaproteobacteria bacterium]
MVIDIKLDEFFPEFEVQLLEATPNARQPTKSVLSDDVLLSMKHEIENDFKVLSEENDINQILASKKNDDNKVH